MGTLGENKAPKFVRKPQLRQEDDGNRLIFECELSGHPQPQVRKTRHKRLKRLQSGTTSDKLILYLKNFKFNRFLNILKCK